MVGLAIAFVKNNIQIDVNFNISQQSGNPVESRTFGRIYYVRRGHGVTMSGADKVGKNIYTDVDFRPKNDIIIV